MSAGLYRPAVDRRPLVSVLVVTFNHADEIASCLDGALRQRGEAHDLEVVVVDNASADGTAEVVADYGDAVKLVTLATNTGFAGGVNTAFEHASGDVVVLLNPDCVMDEGCVEALWRHLVDHPGVGCAAANLRYPDGRPQLFARRELTVPTVLWCFTEVGRRLDRLRGGRALARRRYEAEMTSPVTAPLEVDCPAAACVATWRQLLVPRPMDPDLPIVFNDAELYRRLRADAFRCEVVPTAGAEHAYGTSLQRVAQGRMRAEFIASLRRYQSPVWSRTTATFVWAALLLDALASTVLGVTGPRRRPARVSARGTLGGLGLPFGAKPWLAPIASPPARLRAVLARTRPRTRQWLRRVSRRVRRRWFIVRLHAAAWLVRSRVTTDIHPTADLPRRVTFEVRPRCRPTVRIGRDVHVQRGLTLRLAGDLDVDERCQLRYDVSLNVKGRLRFDRRVVFGRGTTIHAHGAMTWGWGSMAGEYVSVIDSTHVTTGVPIHPFDQPVDAADVHLEPCVWLAAHATVTAGVTIGQGTTVGAGAVVSRSLPPGVLAVGAPAAPLRPQAATWAVPAARS